MVRPAARKKAAGALREQYEISERRASRLLRLHRSTLQYRPKPDRSDELRTQLRELATIYPRYGYRMLTDKLSQAGHRANHKRVYRVYREEGLQLPKRRRKRIRSAKRVPLAPAAVLNERWSMDFMLDMLSDGRRFRVLTVMDEFSRECLALDVAISIPGVRVTRVLDAIAATRGYPKVIVSDNKPEFTGRALDQWASRHGVRLHFIQPGKPTQNAFIESLNGTLRTECLSADWFVDLADARHKTQQWRREYNEQRPHSKIGRVPPAVFARNHQVELESSRPIQGGPPFGGRICLLMNGPVQGVTSGRRYR
jgi:putative transposase